MRRFTGPTIRPATSSFGSEEDVMRTNTLVMVGALLLVAAGASAQDLKPVAANQQDVAKTSVLPANADIPLVNQIDFGFRGTVFGSGSDQARFQRYRDLRDGGTIDRFRFFRATESLDFNVTVRNTQKAGAYPWGGSFGIGGAIATELPVPVDHRTTDLGTSLEFANRRGYARLAYDGSFFHNNVPTLVWDNP